MINENESNGFASTNNLQPFVQTKFVGSSYSPPIERLRGRDNYSDWAFQMKMTLINQGLWGTIKPRDNEVVTDEMQLRALSIICLSVDKCNYSHMKSAETASDAWVKLEKAFTDSGLTRWIGLLRQLTNVRLSECDSVEVYVDKLVTTSQLLSNAGFEVDDEWLAALLLKGLPDSYEPMIMTLEASGVRITTDLVKSKILQDVKKDPDSNALYTNKDKNKRRNNKKQGQQQQQQQQFKPKFCSECGQPGHGPKNCHKNQGAGYSQQKGSRSGRAFMVSTSSDSNDWLFDSGATQHMSKTDLNFVKKKPISHSIQTAGDSRMNAIAKGEVVLDGEIMSIPVKDVLIVPKLSMNLLSISQICKRGFKVFFGSSYCEVIDQNGEVYATGTQKDGLYVFDKRHSKAMVTRTEGAELWHRRTRHLNFESLKKLKSLSIGITFSDTSIQTCLPCIQEKQARLPFHFQGKKAVGVLDLVHGDVVGPMEVESLGGSRYLFTLVDDASSKMFCYFLKSKDQVFEMFQDFKNMVENQTNRRIKVFRSDNGTEFVNKQMEKLFKKSGIRHQLTVPYNPEQNGKAERANRTVIERARSMLADTNLPKCFWAEAVNTAVYLINRSPTKSQSITPEEAWTGVKPDITFESFWF